MLPASSQAFAAIPCRWKHMLGYTKAGCRFVLCLAALSPSLKAAEPIVVRDVDGLRSAIRAVQPGTVLQIAPGEYPGGHGLQGVDRLTVEGLDPENPPVFLGGSTGWHFSRCNQLTIRHLKLVGQTGNGLNIDDGGQLDQPARQITMEHVTVSDIGPRGNHDGIKCSGLKQVTIRNCSISGWGGQGIDFVGCHHALISGCQLTGKPGFTATAGIQLKGGTSDVTVEKCHFLAAGQRPINLGGSTGLRFFRPQGANYEARRLVVRENLIEGSPCAAAFVGVDGAEFVGNTILYPEKWIFRILQETREPGFVACRDVRIRDNKIVFRRSEVNTEINIGPGTAPESFRFENNQWYAEDRPQNSQPSLPVQEMNGSYGTDPR